MGAPARARAVRNCCKLSPAGGLRESRITSRARAGPTLGQAACAQAELFIPRLPPSAQRHLVADRPDVLHVSLLIVARGGVGACRKCTIFHSASRHAAAGSSRAPPPLIFPRGAAAPAPAWSMVAVSLDACLIFYQRKNTKWLRNLRVETKATSEMPFLSFMNETVTFRSGSDLRAAGAPRKARRRGRPEAVREEALHSTVTKTAHSCRLRN
ncbi:hypothetical protein EVAR_338_1 [Eumeta japonica]|uniref:Uncharacterized protein n=1 Tax=Eumeta variegata TaxID=151549 RepID=A0A4C1SAR5_EUMVA|nr:hypothetical protein EVAR_338_1 [Eumeta japonica]